MHSNYNNYLKKIILLVFVTFGMIKLSDLAFANGIAYINFILMVILVSIIPNIIFVFIERK